MIIRRTSGSSDRSRRAVRVLVYGTPRPRQGGRRHHCALRPRFRLYLYGFCAQCLLEPERGATGGVAHDEHGVVAIADPVLVAIRERIGGIDWSPPRCRRRPHCPLGVSLRNGKAAGNEVVVGGVTVDAIPPGIGLDADGRTGADPCPRRLTAARLSHPVPPRLLRVPNHPAPIGLMRSARYCESGLSASYVVLGGKASHAVATADRGGRATWDEHRRGATMIMNGVGRRAGT